MEYLHSHSFKKTSFYLCAIEVSKKPKKSIKLRKKLIKKTVPWKKIDETN